MPNVPLPLWHFVKYHFVNDVFDSKPNDMSLVNDVLVV